MFRRYSSTLCFKSSGEGFCAKTTGAQKLVAIPKISTAQSCRNQRFFKGTSRFME
jgi:hypothetical protein